MEFLQYVEKNEKSKRRLCREFYNSILQFAWSYDFSSFLSDEKVIMIPPEHSPVLLITRFIKPTRTTADIIEGLREFLSKCEEFSEPKTEAITEAEINLVLDVAQKDYRILNIIASKRPLKILRINNSHCTYDAECGIGGVGENTEGILFIYSPNNMETHDRVFIFAHELGHALHLALTKDIEKMPYRFNEVNEALGLKELTQYQKKEAFADAIAMGILNCSELKEHLPLQYSKEIISFFSKYLLIITSKHLESM